jgi:hypothetical protein
MTVAIRPAAPAAVDKFIPVYITTFCQFGSNTDREMEVASVAPPPAIAVTVKGAKNKPKVQDLSKLPMAAVPEVNEVVPPVDMSVID